MTDLLSFSSMTLVVDGRDPSIAWLKKNFSNPKTTKLHGATTHIIRRSIIDKRFYWFYSSYGKGMPRPDNILDTKSGQSINNPRKTQQVEPTRQLFAIYDDVSKLFYISQLKQKKFLAEFLSEISNSNVIIKNIYKDIDNFAKITKKFNKIEFTKTRTGSSKEEDIFTPNTDILGFNERAKFKIKVQYEIPIVDGIKKRISTLNKHKKEGNIENLIIKGEDEKGFEAVFNADSFTSKISISLNKDKQHLFPPEEVKGKIIAELKK